MRKSIAVVFAITFILFLQSTAFSQSPNLVPNGNFEKKDDNSIAAGWKTKVYRGTDVEFTLDEKIHHQGNLSLKARFSEKGGSAMLYVANDIQNVMPGQTYRISLWIKAQELGYSPNFIAPALRFNFRPTPVRPVPTIDLMVEMKGAEDWRELSLLSTAPPDADTITLQIMLTKGTIWIDEVSITPVTQE